MGQILDVHAREILDSRGNPTDRRDIIKWIEKRADISSIKSFKFLDNWLVNKSGNQTIFKEIKSMFKKSCLYFSFSFSVNEALP